ncbi:MAG TPA: BTAD domain-containing putative transcriptional regulator [Gemmatimonadales bacterium]|jgi:serine/threonine-protein kinase|nr:BTAD domain-containing putative transcriptional regulator [Gemmatimonadales bacterium]
MPLETRLFGNLAFAGASGAERLAAQPKVAQLLVYLLLARPRGYHRRDRLAGLFWPDQPDTRARGSLRNALYVLRELLGEGVILTRGDDEVAVAAEQLRCDAHAFDAAIAAGELARALELYQGELLEGTFPELPGVEQWLEGERVAYREAAAEAAWQLALRYETATDLTSATRWARKAARLARTDERRIRRILQLLDRAGDRAGAIQIYEDFARFLQREYDLTPSAETRGLVQAIREGRR